MDLPEDVTLPFFTYGIFKPGELGFLRIREFVESVETATVAGILKQRDGLPLLAQARECEVHGVILHFKTGIECDAYRRMTQIEPGKYYFGKKVSVAGSSRLQANSGARNQTRAVTGCPNWNLRLGVAEKTPCSIQL